MSKANTEFGSWIICPKCQSAMVGEVGEECFICGVECVATPLYPDIADTEAARIVSRVQKARADQADSAEQGDELDPEVWG